MRVRWVGQNKEVKIKISIFTISNEKEISSRDGSQWTI
jgi:hypothetical protein